MKTKNPPVSAAKPVQLYQSSKARSSWGQLSKKALDGESVAILFGERVFLLKEVQLTYAEKEYGVTLEQLDAKSEEIRQRGLKEIRSGKARKVA